MYKDERLMARQEKFGKSKLNILENREKQNLSLRKRQLDDLLSEKRFRRKNTSEYEIIPFTLNVNQNLQKITYDLLNNYEYSKFITNILGTTDILSDDLKYAVYLLREYFSQEKNVEYIHFLNEGLLFNFLTILSNTQDKSLINEIIWILTNISYLALPSEISFILDPAYINTLIIHFRNTLIDDITVNILWLFSNLTFDSKDFRDKILESCLVDEIINKINYLFMNINEVQKRDQFIYYVVILFYHFINENFDMPQSLLPQIYKIIPILTVQFLFNNDKLFSMCIKSIRIISGLEDVKNPLAIPNLILSNDGQIILSLLALDYTEYNYMLNDTLMILGNLFSTENNEIISYLLEFDILFFIESLLIQFKNKKILKHIVWIISNICTGDPKHAQEIAESNLFKHLLSMVSDFDYEVKREAVYTLMLICVNNPTFNLCFEMVKKDIYLVLIELLKDINVNIVKYALRALEAIFEKGEALKALSRNNLCLKFKDSEGVAVLEKLFEHRNKEVYEMVTKIYNKYFNTCEIEEKMDLDVEVKFEPKPNNTSTIQNPFLIKSNNNFEITFGNNFNIKPGLTQNVEHSYSFHSELKYLDADKNVNMTESTLLSDILNSNALKSKEPSKKMIKSKPKI